MKKPALGQQELEVLRYVADNAPISVRQVAEQFGEPRGLARTTILTMMERLRKKGFLTRRKGTGVFEYAPAVAKTEILHDLVQNFVEKTLGGSLSPFVAYLAESKDLSEDEINELKELIDRL
ncbi:MAG TPA: BlaI/MecI/CopY family transcriptional regulator [Hyphomicrobiales bacterium]|nr:BlaI/MecI/CopY family transcriptional regulator [Hyphomicrobiales bacterium]